MRRERTVIGLLGFVPLIGAMGCRTGGAFAFFCVVSPDIWLVVWAALLGMLLSLTIRLVLERRRFERAASDGRAA